MAAFGCSVTIDVQNQYGAGSLIWLLEHVLVSDVHPGVDGRGSESRGLEIDIAEL